MKGKRKKSFLGMPRDEWSFKTHAIGCALSIFATLSIVIYYTAFTSSEPGRILVFCIFGASMIAMYLCSSIYHYSNADEEKVIKLRKLDHSMIYVLIAGTYTPVIYDVMHWPKNIIWMAGIWSFAVVGIVIKVFCIKAPRWSYTAIYILMGWAIVFDYKSMTDIPQLTVIWLVAGGIAYTVGALIYILKKPNLFKKFGFHEIFHVFIMIGTICHFTAVLVLK